MRTLKTLSTGLLLVLFVFVGCEQPTVNSPMEKAVAPEGDFSLPKKGKSYGIPVTITFTNANSDNIRSDKNDPYIDEEDGVRAYINHPNTDDLILDTDYYFRPRKGAVPRKVFFDLTQPVSGSGAIERGTQTLVAFLNVDKLYDVSLATGFAQFNFGGYILRFGVEDGTDPVQVTGTPAEGPWSVTTTGDGIAKLLKFKRGRLVDLGNYYMPFSITIGLKK